MFWPFRRQLLRPTQRPGVRLSLESLEGRDLPSVSVIPFINPSSGAATVSNVSSAQAALPHATQATTTKDSEGAATQIPAFFNGQQFTVNMLELPNGGENAVLANNPSVNTIFAQADLDQAQPFPPVINALQGAGFNPHWQQVLISFNTGVTPHGFTSEAEVQAAAAAGQITLEVTNEVYRCSVVGPGPK